MAGGIASSTPQEYALTGEDPYRLDGVSAGTRPTTAYSGVEGSYFERTPSPEQTRNLDVEPQQVHQPFLVPQSVDRRDLPAEQGVASNDWIAPVAAGVGVGGLAAAAAQAPAEHEPAEIVKTPEEEKPEVPEKSSLRSSPPESAVVVGEIPVSRETTGANVVALPTAASTNTTHGATTADLGGLESEGAHETGRIFPKVIRHDTDMSISQLHVPGKFPKQS